VAHTCNPSYSGARDQEDRGSKPVRAKLPITERAGGVAQSEGPAFKPQDNNKKNGGLGLRACSSGRVSA
jgi:hypothetical protein